jgi:hypothetical protein
MVHALEPRELARMFTGVLLILALTSSVAPKLISALRARKSAPKLPKQYSTTA